MGKKQREGRLAWAAVLALTTSCSGARPPRSPGMADGTPAPCPGSPNCVSSEAVAVDQRVEPLRYDGDAARARARLLEVVNGMVRARTVRSTDLDLHAKFRSAVFGFVDDVEFYFGPPGTIQVRSASRTGYYDVGVNRERVETIRAGFAASPNGAGTSAS
jgi:uncharacterized protein (DUF1499 family)